MCSRRFDFFPFFFLFKLLVKLSKPAPQCLRPKLSVFQSLSAFVQLCSQVAVESITCLLPAFYAQVALAACWWAAVSTLYVTQRSGVQQLNFCCTVSCLTALCSLQGEIEQRHLNCLHVSSCSHFLPQIFPLAKCPSQSLLPNPGVQLLRPGLLSL